MPLDDRALKAHQRRNALQTIVLVGGLLLVAGVIGYSLAGLTGLFLMAVGAALFLFAGQRATPQMTMRAFKARPIDAREAPALTEMVDELAQASGLLVAPKLYYIPSRMANAFATGSRKAPLIAVTDGILRMLSERELRGVLAHEMSHLKNGDLQVMKLADLAARTAHTFSRLGQLLLLINLPLVLFGGAGLPWLFILALVATPWITSVMQMSLSRTREYEADLDAAQLTGDPVGLASALRKLEQASAGMFERVFLPGRRIPEPSLLRTHPETEERVKRLYAFGHVPYAPPEGPPSPSPDEFLVPRPPTPPRAPRWHFISGAWH